LGWEFVAHARIYMLDNSSWILLDGFSHARMFLLDKTKTALFESGFRQ